MRAREFITESASLVAAIKKQFPDQANVVDHWNNWAVTALKKSDRVTWFLKILRADLGKTLGPKELGTYQFTDMQKLATDIHHFYGIDYAPIKNYNYNTQSISQVIADLTAFENAWREEQEKNRGVTPQEGDYKLFEFADGTAWWWVSRGYCPEEGRSGGHCGNVEGQYETDQRLLSLRDKERRVICTFALRSNGTLREMKAKNNQKPAAKYHPQIMKLLMWDKITGIADIKGQYNPSINFNVFDLNEQQLAYIDQTKPELITTQIESMPVSALRMPEPLKEKYQGLVTKANPVVGKLLFNATDTEWSDAVEEDPKLIMYAPTTIDNWRDRVIDIISRTRFLLIQAPAYIGKNYELLKDIVERTPERIVEINPNLKGYDKLCLIAVNQDGLALNYIPEELKTPEMFLLAVKQNGFALEHVPDQLKTEELCWAAIKQNGRALIRVPDKLKTPEMFLLAVKQNGFALEYVPSKLRTEEICLAAVEQNGFALRYVPSKLRTEEICLAAVKQNAEALEYVPNELKTEPMCLAAVKSNGMVLDFVPIKLRTPEMYQLAVKSNGMMLDVVPDELKTEPICLAAVKSNGMALQFVPDELKTEPICLAAVNNSGWMLQLVPDELKTEPICLAAVKSNGMALQFVPDELKTLEICVAAFKQNDESYWYIPDNLKDRVEEISGINAA